MIKFRQYPVLFGVILLALGFQFTYAGPDPFAEKDMSFYTNYPHAPNAPITVEDDQCNDPGAVPFANGRLQGPFYPIRNGRWDYHQINFVGPDIWILHAEDFDGLLNLGGWRIQDGIDGPRAMTRIQFVIGAGIDEVQITDPVYGAIEGDSHWIYLQPEDVVQRVQRCNIIRSTEGRRWLRAYNVGDLYTSLKLYGRGEPNLVRLIRCLDLRIPDAAIAALQIPSCTDMRPSEYTPPGRNYMPLTPRFFAP